MNATENAAAALEDAEFMELMNSMCAPDTEPMSIQAPANLPTPHVGTGGLAAAQQSAGPNSLVISIGRGEFYGFASTTDRAEFVDANRDKMVFERVNGARPFAPVLDVDGTESLTEDGINAIRDAWVVSAIAAGVPPELAEPVAVRSTRPGKVSVHFIAQGWQVADGPAGRAFADSIRTQVPEGLKAFIDASACGCSETATFAMRLPLVPKTDPKGVVIPGSTLVPEDACNNDQPSDWFLQGAPDAGQVYEIDGATHADVAAEVDTGDLATFAAALATQYPEYCQDPARPTRFNRVSSSHCKSCNRVHDAEGAYVRERAGTLWFNCGRAELGGEPLATHQTADAPAPVAPPQDGYDIIDEDAEEANEQYNTDAFDLDEMVVRDNYVRSMWGTGKTRMARDLINRTDDLVKGKHHRPARVLFISSRKTLSSGIAADLGLTDYRTIKGPYDDAAIRASPRAVFQVESLKRIPSDVKPFDLVIVDEPCALFAHVYQGASHAARLGLTTATGHIRRAARLYVSDNDLSTEMVRAFRQVRKGMPSRVLVNKYKSWEGTAVDILTGKPSVAETRRRLFAFADGEAVKREAGANWSGCVVPCHSRKVANAIELEAVERYGRAFVKCYTGMSDDREKAVDFVDPVAAWGEVAVVIYTTTVSVGVSEDSEHFTHAFAFFMGMVGGSMIAGSQQSAQMLFRCRNLKRLTVSYTGQAVYGLPITLPKLMPWVTTSRRRHNIPDNFREDRNAMIDEPTQEDPDALEKLITSKLEGIAWVCNILEKHRSASWFVDRLVKTVTDAGCVATVTNLTNSVVRASTLLAVPVDQLVESRTTLSAMEARAGAECDTLAAQSMEDAVWAYRDAESHDTSLSDDKRPLTRGEHHGRHAMYAAKVYQDGGGMVMDDPLKLSEEDRASWVRHHTESSNTQAYKQLTAIVRGYDAFSPMATTGGVQTAVRSDNEAARVVRKAFDALGITQTLLTGAPCTLELKDLGVPSAAILATICDINTHARRLFGDQHAYRRKKAEAKGVTAKTVVNALNVALRFVGASIASTYVTARDKHQGRPSGYTILWVWESTAGRAFQPIEAPAPRPTHPSQ